MIYFTSDNHFFHKNIIRFENRPFDTMFKMNHEMIHMWNMKVRHTDTVYILGDFSFGNKQQTIQLIRMLNGRKILIRGNHDKVSMQKEVKECFEYVTDYKRIKHDGKDVILFHYPIDVWDKQHHGSIHLYGHVHSHLNTDHPMRKPHPNMYNAGADVNGFVPCTLEEIIENNKSWVERIWVKENYFKCTE